MENKLTDLQAFNAMRIFLEGYYERTGSDDIGSLLSDIQFFGADKETADPAAWEDWIDSIKEVLEEKDSPLR